MLTIELESIILVERTIMTSSKDTSSKLKKKNREIDLDLVDAMTGFRISCRNGVLKNILVCMQNVLAISVPNNEQGISSKTLLSTLVLNTDSSQSSALTCAMDGGHDSIVDFFICLLFAAFFDKLDPQSIQNSLSLNDWSTGIFGNIHPKLKSGWLKRLGKKNGFDSITSLLEERTYTASGFIKRLSQYLDDIAGDKNLISLSISLGTVLQNAKKVLHDMKSTHSKVRKPKINLREYSNRYDVLDDDFDDHNASRLMEDSYSSESKQCDAPDVNIAMDIDPESCHDIITDNETEEEEDETELSSDECDWDMVSCSDMDDFEEVQYSFKDALARSDKPSPQSDSFILIDGEKSDGDYTVGIDRSVEVQVEEEDFDFDRSGYKHISKGRFYKNDRAKREYMRKLSKRKNVLVQN